MKKENHHVDVKAGDSVDHPAEVESGAAAQAAFDMLIVHEEG